MVRLYWSIVRELPQRVTVQNRGEVDMNEQASHLRTPLHHLVHMFDCCLYPKLTHGWSSIKQAVWVCEAREMRCDFKMDYVVEDLAVLLQVFCNLEVLAYRC